MIDACAFHEWSSPHDLTPYLSAGWAELITREGDVAGPLNVKTQWLYQHPLGDKLADASPEHGVPGSDRELFARQVVDARAVERAVLGYDDGLLATGYPLPYLAREFVKAANDWTIETWLERDRRLYGQVLVVSGLPDDAAAEIRRVGTHEQMVAVALGANTLGRPFGHPVYQPIYAAAAELELPLVLQDGCDAMADLATVPVSGGLPSTYAEYDALRAHAVMGHVTAMITAGVFDLFPRLQVLIVGAGAAWVPSFLWRVDYNHKFVRRTESPWMQQSSIDYFTRHVRLGTYRLERPRNAEWLAQVLEAIPEVESMLLYSSGYPNVDEEGPDAIGARLPHTWHGRVFHDNALEFFRWPREASAPVASPARSMNFDEAGRS